MNQRKLPYLSQASTNVSKVKSLFSGLKEGRGAEENTGVILALVARKLLNQRFGTEINWNAVCERVGRQNADVQSFVATINAETEPTAFHEFVSSIPFAYEQGEDLLGFLYLSLRKLRERKKSGSYYTPVWVAKRLVEGLTKTGGLDEKNILDPACGTGSILLQLPKACSYDRVYGCDIDPLAVMLLRINMALRYKILDEAFLKTHFRVRDYLMEGFPVPVELVIGNPPWGVQYRKRGMDSSDLFLEQAMASVESGGVIRFVLPEALLYVRSHQTIREQLLQKARLRRVEYLGEAFDKVQCPCVLLTLEKSGEEQDEKGVRFIEALQSGEASDGAEDTRMENDIRVVTPTREFTIRSNRSFAAREGLPLDVTDAEYALLHKLLTLPNCVTLRNNARFALGIVSGDNKRFIKPEPCDGYEGVLRGTDIERFFVAEPSVFIEPKLSQFQQSAPLSLYRAPSKLLYRFVGKRPVFALDESRALTLNSCNIVIPDFSCCPVCYDKQEHTQNVERDSEQDNETALSSHLTGASSANLIDIKYILAILNSSVTEFIHKRRNHSMKLLRSHIEAFPIPFVDKDRQQPLIDCVEALMKEGMKSRLEDTKGYQQLDRLVAELFLLSEEEYALVRKATLA